MSVITSLSSGLNGVTVIRKRSSLTKKEKRNDGYEDKYVQNFLIISKVVLITNPMRHCLGNFFIHVG